MVSSPLTAPGAAQTCYLFYCKDICNLIAKLSLCLSITVTTVTQGVTTLTTRGAAGPMSTRTRPTPRWCSPAPATTWSPPTATTTAGKKTKFRESFHNILSLSKHSESTGNWDATKLIRWGGQSMDPHCLNVLLGLTDSYCNCKYFRLHL